MLQPLRGKLLVRVLEDSKRTSSGLYLAGIKEEVPHRGLVIEIGAPYRDLEQREYPWGIQIGHVVHFKRVWGPQEKSEHIVLRREQIYAVEHEDKSYAIGEYILIKKDNPADKSPIFIPDNFDVKVEVQIGYGEVASVGRDDKLGLSVGDRICYFKNEGLSVRIPLQEELWSLKPRAVIGVVTTK